MKHYNPTNKKILIPKRQILYKFLYKNNNKSNIYNNKNSNSFGKKRNRRNNFLDYSNNSYKKTISSNNSTKKYILKLKNKIFNNASNKKALRGKKSNYSFIKSNINKNKLFKNVIKDNNNNISYDKNSFFQANNKNYMNNKIGRASCRERV